MLCGAYEEALHVFMGSVTSARQLRYVEAEAHAIGNVGLAQMALGHFTLAIDSFSVLPPPPPCPPPGWRVYEQEAYMHTGCAKTLGSFVAAYAMW